MKKIVIIGASYLQLPLVEKAKEMAIETHVFAWEDGAVAKKIADHFYPISILEKELILEQCKEIKPDGIVSIGSDLAMLTVNYIAVKMGLISNTLACTKISTNKYAMRKAFKKHNVSCPNFVLANDDNLPDLTDFTFPLIVKPTDRSGSRGVTKVNSIEELQDTITKAQEISLSREAIIEEYLDGREFSIEMISDNGRHHYLTITDKVTTEAPYFVEIEHHQPADISAELERKIIAEVKKGLYALDIKYGASHSEVKLTSNGEIRIIEIAGRMGGELIGSDMVYYSTGYDFVKGVIEIALNDFSGIEKLIGRNSGVYYVLPKAGKVQKIIDHSSSFPKVKKVEIMINEGELIDRIVDGAGKRAAVFVYADDNERQLLNPLEVVEYITK